MSHVAANGLHLSAQELKHVVRMGVRACRLAVSRAEYMRYTQLGERWSAFDEHVRSYRGEVPHKTDCSGFATWVHWDATLSLHPGDYVNGERWLSGHTGTLVQHGEKVSLDRLRPLDLVFYGDEGWRPGHVAVYVGNGQVASFGSDPGPFLLPVRYRRDVGIWAPRRYLHA